MGGHKERKSKLNRDAGIKSRYKRCPKCKKRRMYWMPANWWSESRKEWKALADGTKICFICAEREPSNEN